MLKRQIKVNPTMAWLTLELQVKASHLENIQLLGRMDPIIIELILLGGRKRSQEENWVVMQCYYRSECGRNGYRKRTHPIWNEMGMFNVTEQKLVDQKNNILMANRLSDLKLEETQRNINDIRHCEVGL